MRVYLSGGQPDVVTHEAGAIQLAEVAHAAHGRGKSIALRLQPTMYDYTKQTAVAWRGVSWSAICQDATEAEQLRQVLECVFVQAGRVGIQKVLDTLLAVA